MLPVQFAYLAAAINFCCTLSYAYFTLRGQTQPNRVTWFIWALAPFIATAAQISSGVGLSTLVVFMTGLGPTIVLTCSFVNKNAYWKIDTLDYICGGLALCGVVSWFLSANASLAIIFSIAADFLAAIPTLRKSVTAPESESGLGFLFSALGTILGVLCVQEFTFHALGFILYLASANTMLCLIINRRRFYRFFQLLIKQS